MEEPKESIAKAIQFREELTNPRHSTKYTEYEYKGKEREIYFSDRSIFHKSRFLTRA